jgi:hypothetical protein
MRCVASMMQSGLAIAVLLSSPFLASSQVAQKSLFALHVTKVKRVNDGCTVDAESPTVRFKLSSDLPAPCAMLRAGETYKAFRATVPKDPKDETTDSLILAVYNNVKNVRRDSSVFEVDSEEAVARK